MINNTPNQTYNLTTYFNSVTLLCFLLLIEIKNISNTITITVTSIAKMIPIVPPITTELLDVDVLTIPTE